MNNLEGLDYKDIQVGNKYHLSKDYLDVYQLGIVIGKDEVDINGRHHFRILFDPVPPYYFREYCSHYTLYSIEFDGSITFHPVVIRYVS